MASIQDGPHFEIHSSELGRWVEQQGTDRWWNVDGDPLLTGRLTFPCPADELAAELRALDRPLLVQAKSAEARGQSIDHTQLDGLVARFFEVVHAQDRQYPPWAGDRFFYLCWKGAPHEWVLAEDSVTTRENQADVASVGE